MNKIVLIGRLTRNPELRYSQGGKAFATFTLAVDRKMWSKKQDGQAQADFIPCMAWDKLAEIVGNNLAKGRRVGVEGRLQTRTYDAKDGSKRSAFDVMVDEMEFLDPKGQQGQGQFPPLSQSDMDEEIPF